MAASASNGAIMLSEWCGEEQYRGDSAVFCLHRPWINDINAAVLKVLHVARSEACSSRTSHRDNHGIELADRLTCRSSRGGDFRIHVRSIAVETQHLTGEIFIKNLLCGIPQSSPTLAVADQSNTIENLSPSYATNQYS